MNAGDLENDSQAQETEQTEFITSRNELEQKIAGVWQNLLHRDDISIHSHFFALGGDSLMLMHMIAELNALGIWLDFQQLFQDWHKASLTIADLAKQAAVTEMQLLAEVDQLADDQIDALLTAFTFDEEDKV